MNDLTGQKLGRLLVVCDSGDRDDRGGIIWGCVCECGNLTGIRGYDLKSGIVKSCGCLRRKTPEKVSDDALELMEKYDRKIYRETKHLSIKHRHGDSRGGKVTRLYAIWNSMKERCHNTNNLSYKYYGKKGIGVCDEWKDDYLAFKKWALANGYADNLTIDRIDNNGSYEPLNCQWITKSENSIKSHKERNHEKNVRTL